MIDYYIFKNLLFVLPELLDAEDVQFVPIDVRQEAIGLPQRLAFRSASAVSHQIHTVTCKKTEK